MKGSNELRINEATMIEIVQQWMDRIVLNNTSDVVGVGQIDDQNGTFQIELAERKPKP